MSEYPIWLVIAALAILGAVVLPRILEDQPFSFPILYVLVGGIAFSVVPGAPTVDPVANAAVTERLTELVIIISLMGAGLKLDRPFHLVRWSATWRLLAITLPLTTAAMAVLAWGVLGLLPATAILLGAVVAPTDPVLASGVEAGAPLTELEEEDAPEHEWGTTRFALTSEAGLNDGLAFPLTNLAIAVAAVSVGTVAAPLSDWILQWLLVDVGYKIAAGVAVGYLVGEGMARFVFRLPSSTQVAETMAGAEALATTLLAYGLTELVAGYGFIAVFVAALGLRGFEWEHEYYRELHDFAAVAERLLMATVLVLFGGALAGGLLAPLTPLEALVGLLLVFVVRPAAGLLGFVGSRAPWRDRAVISFFGIRGVGSFYYLAYALSHASFGEIELTAAAEELWAFVGFVVLVSIVLHGISSSPVMEALDRRRERVWPRARDR